MKENPISDKAVESLRTLRERQAWAARSGVVLSLNEAGKEPEGYFSEPVIARQAEPEDLPG